MLFDQQKLEFGSAAEAGQTPPSSEAPQLIVNLNVAAGGFEFAWQGAGFPAARGQLTSARRLMFGLYDLEWVLESEGKSEKDHCSQWHASIRALLSRMRKRFPVPE